MSDIPAPAPFFAQHRSTEWLTPSHVVELAVACLGTIDTDPCAGPEPFHIPATTHYTEQQDGLRQPLYGRVYMHPPYGHVLFKWTKHLRAEITAGHTTEAILLVPANTETRWFGPIWGATRLCFVKGRLAFLNADRQPIKGATFGSAIAYFGTNPDRFSTVFSPLGQVVTPTAPPDPAAPPAPDRVPR